MTNSIEFQIKERPGFPVKIGEIELWFDDSIENLSNFFDAQKELIEKENKIAEEYQKYKDIDEESMDTKTAKKILELKKESVCGYYDSVFGEGSFKKVYEKYPYVSELEELVMPISNSINETIIKKEKDRTKMIEEKKQKALKKKANMK